MELRFDSLLHSLPSLVRHHKTVLSTPTSAFLSVLLLSAAVLVLDNRHGRRDPRGLGSVFLLLLVVIAEISSAHPGIDSPVPLARAQTVSGADGLRRPTPGAQVSIFGTFAGDEHPHSFFAFCH
ncbi:hypothetical protein SORBI_3010G211700 [Sorghum bicolor]|nr:hypothetical protein SORBI_3010G211700 [Sorghum bicolor]